MEAKFDFILITADALEGRAQKGVRWAINVPTQPRLHTSGPLRMKGCHPVVVWEESQRSKAASERLQSAALSGKDFAPTWPLPGRGGNANTPDQTLSFRTF